MIRKIRELWRDLCAFVAEFYPAAPSAPTCATCRHWRKSSEWQDAGACTRYPPTRTQGRPAYGGAIAFHTFPNTPSTSGCGEHRR